MIDSSLIKILSALFNLAGPLKGRKRLASILIFVVLIAFIFFSQTVTFDNLFQYAFLDANHAFWLFLIVIILLFVLVMALLTPDLLYSTTKEFRMTVHVFRPGNCTDHIAGAEVRVHKTGPALLPQTTNTAGIAEFRFIIADEGKEAAFCAWQNGQHSDEFSASLKDALQVEIPWDIKPILPTTVVIDEIAESRPLPQAFDELLKNIKQENTVTTLSSDTMIDILKHSPVNLTEHRLSRIAEWSQPKYQLDRRFVELTVLIDQGEKAEGERFIEQPKSPRFDDLRKVLEYLPQQQALVVLGEPGCGKSTLLRRLQLDDCLHLLRAGDEQRYSFFVSLNSYHADPGKALPLPKDWLAERWISSCPKLPSLTKLTSNGQMLLLLDGLNEMPHADANDYAEKVALLQQFLTDTVAKHPDNRVVFSCRTLNYSASLSTDALPVPQIQVQRMIDKQVQQFLAAYLPEHAELTWGELKIKPLLLDLLRTPYYLKLLTEQVQEGGKLPQGRAGLFTGFVRKTLHQQVFVRHNPLLIPDSLLDQRDHTKLASNAWLSAFDLPQRGLLISELSKLAFSMQKNSPGTDSKQVSINYDDAYQKLPGAYARSILEAGSDLSILDEDISRDEIKFFHQLLQEYFAARCLAKNPNPLLVKVEWLANSVSPTLAETVQALADGDPLPPLPATGWEESMVLAVAMTAAPQQLIRQLMEENLPLAVRCFINPEVKPDETLKSDLQQALIKRTQNPDADLRARIAAGEALGRLGDPRFKLCKGLHGDFLFPPLVNVPAGDYPIGDDNASYDDEKPAHSVTLAAFQIGKFPVTNAEYKLFLDAKGYENPNWWDTTAAKAWLKGEGSNEGRKQATREFWQVLQSWSEERIQEMVPYRWTTQQAENYLWMKNLSREELETKLTEQFPDGVFYRQPEYWEDTRFNNQQQPVVGITWFEARAYCKWLAAQSGKPFRLPSEVEREAATRGLAGRVYAYPGEYNATLCNTFETHVRRTTPIGVFPGGETPEGAWDLSGNVWNWTSTIFDQELFPYRYNSKDGRENPEAEGYRTLRGGSWDGSADLARGSCRLRYFPGNRINDGGFRVACTYLKADSDLLKS
ncbi:MAG: SUMF1/EgtB/PvdO family nonheme iron enzyme [Anaerolineaceae bacterium]|nr:SUMF1/EgtB/PvdO family nonheme iron enzyme [Anaerolineaceae bacterium]